MNQRAIFWLLGTFILVLLAVSWRAAPAQEAKRIGWFRQYRVVNETALAVYWVHIPLNDKNRYAHLIAWDGEFPVQGTLIDLAGERRRTLWDQAKWRLPPGEIILMAVLYGVKDDGSQGELARDVSKVIVVAQFQ